MALQSDFVVDASKFRSERASEEVKQTNKILMDRMKSEPKWFQVGAAKYREKQAKGQTMMPVSVVLDRGESFAIPSKEKGREIPCRIMKPKSGKDAKAIFMYIHGGGWLFSSETEADTILAKLCDDGNVVVLSVGYRLAPENPYPKGPEDCYDAAAWLVDNAKDRFGVELQFVGGDSAGGHLSMLTYLHLAQTRPQFHLSGLVLNYGVFDLTFLPRVHHFKKRETLILDKELMEHLVGSFCPGMSFEQLRDPWVSPFYHDLAGLELPPAMFTCGTEDCMLDDTVMMSVRWQAVGGKAVVKIYPGAPHGYTFFPDEMCPEAKQGLDANCSFLREMTR